MQSENFRQRKFQTFCEKGLLPDLWRTFPIPESATGTEFTIHRLEHKPCYAVHVGLVN